MIADFKTILVKKERLTNDVWLFRFKIVSDQKIHFIAGQYVLLKIPPAHIDWLKSQLIGQHHDLRGITETGALRQYSICSPENETEAFDLIIQLVEHGVASTYVEKLREGDQVLFQGPAGAFTIKRSERDKLFLATGTGIAPMRSMFLSHLDNKSVGDNSSYFLFWGLKQKSDVYFFSDFRQLAARNSHFNFKICLSRQKEASQIDQDFFGKGRVNVFAQTLIKANPDNFDYYLCGSHVIVEALRQWLLEFGVPTNQIFFEKFV